MRDLDELKTRKGTPAILIFSRTLFTIYFLFAFWAWRNPTYLPNSELNLVWILYLLALYLLVEYLHTKFIERRIVLTFAFPLLWTIYILNLVTLLLGGQEQLPLLNRSEHFASFILLTFIVWVFFMQYLPQKVWQNHPYYTSLIVLSVTSLLGVANEIIELFFDQLFQTNHVGRHLDTSLDLLMNTLGSLTFLSVRLILREYNRTDDEELVSS